MAEILTKKDIELKNIIKDIDNIVTDTQKERIAATDEIIDNYIKGKYNTSSDLDKNIEYKLIYIGKILEDYKRQNPIILEVPSFKGKSGFIYRKKDLTLDICSKIATQVLNELTKEYGYLPTDYKWYWKDKGFEIRANNEITFEEKIDFFIEINKLLLEKTQSKEDIYEMLDLSFALTAILLIENIV